MWEAEVLTPRIIDACGRNRCQLYLDYGLGPYWRAGQVFADITSQPNPNIPTAPNLYSVRATVEPDVLEAIEADDRYYILSAQEIIEEPD